MTYKVLAEWLSQLMRKSTQIVETRAVITKLVRLIVETGVLTGKSYFSAKPE